MNDMITIPVSGTEMIPLMKESLSNLKSFEVNFELNSYEKQFYVLQHKRRLAKEAFTFTDHVRAFILTLLIEGAGWEYVEGNLERIEECFKHFNAESIFARPMENFSCTLVSYECAYPNLYQEMELVKPNLMMMMELDKAGGSIDRYFTSKLPERAAFELLYNKQFHFVGLRYDQICAYMKNVGIDMPNPDPLTYALFSPNRLGLWDDDTIDQNESMAITRHLAEETGFAMSYIDHVTGIFCHSICMKSPKCGLCELRSYCAYEAKPD